MSGRKSLGNAWRDAIRDSDLDRTAKLVAFVVSIYMNGQGWAFPSKATIAEGCNLDSIRTVDVAVQRLERAGSYGRRPPGEPGRRSHSLRSSRARLGAACRRRDRAGMPGSSRFPATAGLSYSSATT